jgi:hypothetical protein
MSHSGKTSPWMRYEVLLDAQRIRQLLMQFASDPVGVVVDQPVLAASLSAQLIPEGDEWILRPLQPAFSNWPESACGALLTLTQGGQQLQVACQGVSRDGQLLHLGLPDCVRYAQLRGESRVSLEQATGVCLTLHPEPSMPIIAEPLDLSLGGLGALLPLATPLGPGEPPCPVILQLPAGTVATTVDVRFMTPDASAWRMGACFDQLDAEQRSLIRDFVMERQRDLRRSLMTPQPLVN